MKFLVIIDMQNDFITGSLANPDAQKIVPGIVDKINHLGDYDTVVLTQDTHYNNYLDTPEGRMLPVKHCIKNTFGHLVHEDIVNAAYQHGSSLFLEKETFGSFDLVEKLREHRAYDIELVGTCTDICVISNALILKAAMPSANITVDASCCAGTTPEMHNAALEVMKRCQIKITDGEEW